ncbi:DUF2357 domain-containing protein [Treponema succinifaciens]|uniref:DUF2357 domain-containing protein n=1 Tax=Treponema succinifaciens TaxID=167 RepID=UPI003FEF7DF8
MLLLEDKRTIDYQIFLDSLKGKNPKAVLLLQLRNWFFSVLKFDPNTGDPLLSDITSFLDKVSGVIPFNKEELEETNNNKFDWLYKSLSYNRQSLLYLLESPRNEIIRSHERMNIYQAREIDSAGIMEISRRPGRTVKEKVAVKPTILAVKREQGADTLENRLLKKYLIRLVNVLDERQKCFDELENEDSTLSRLYSVIRRWLKSEEAERIGKWQNLPPNNILLHDKNYRKIWRGWQFLLDLDEMILNDWNDIDRLLSVYIFWKTLSILQCKGSKILQSPLKFDYNKFEICNIPFESANCVRVEAEEYALEINSNKITVIPKEGKEHIIEIQFDKLIIENKVMPGALVTLSDADNVSLKLANSIDKISENRTIPAGFEEEQKYTAINFSEFPYKSVSVSNTDNFESRDFSTSLIRQFWTANTETDWINLETSNSPASYSERVNDIKIETVSFEDVFFDSEEHMLSEEKLSSAAYDFMNSIRDFYNTNTLYYLLPDYLEDFSLSRIRSTANTVFPNANPVPSSIGTVFAFHKSEEFKDLSLSEDDFAFVIEKSNDNSVFSITPIQAKTTFELNNQKVLKLSDYSEIPYGIRWEHHPSVIIENYNPSKVMDYIKSTVSETEGIEKAGKIVIISGQKSIENARLELPADNWFFFNKSFEASDGAAFCAYIQEKVKEIPMWSEHLPVLQMTYLKNGKRSGSNLTYCKTVLPIRGQRQRIDIPDVFILNKKVRTYHFRLSRGNSDTSSALRYEACLNNVAFPLERNTECRLEMYYTYGEEHPFELYFVPVNSSELIRAKVEWRKIDENAFPVPNFPPIRSWSEFVNWNDGYTAESRDLADWQMKNFNRIKSIFDFIENRPNELHRYTCRVPSETSFEKDNHGFFFSVSIAQNEYAKVYKAQLHSFTEKIRIDNLISFSLNTKREPLIKDGNKVYRTFGVTPGITLSNKQITSFGRSLRFPAIQIWNSSLSVHERKDVPEGFTNAVDNAKKVIEVLLNNDNIYQQSLLWDELLLQTCFMHKDAIEITSKWLDINFFEELDFENTHWRVLEQQLFEVAYFIGNAETDKQKEFFDWLLAVNIENEYLISFKLQALCISLWRGENLLREISPEKISLILNKIYLKLVNELSNIRDCELTNRVLNPTRYYLELLCNLIMARNFGDEYRNIFSPFKSEMKRFIDLVEDIYSLLQRKEKVLVPRQIKFTIDDSENENPFLDYLLSWLDGENSSEMPRIESATSENPDDDEYTSETDEEE